MPLTPTTWNTSPFLAESSEGVLSRTLLWQYLRSGLACHLSRDHGEHA
jgi:hypothetical protein